MLGTIPRRRFLGTAAAGGPALSLATASPLAPGPPSERIILGVMGMGGRGTSLARLFQQQPNVRVKYVCGVDSNRRRAAARAVGQLTDKPPEAIGDFRRILDDREVDALVCAAPDHWHAPATILACAAGKHVYVEKPCCHNPREGELQVLAARKYDRCVQVGTQRRSWPMVIEAMGRLHGGVIGRVLFARSWYNSQRGSIGHGQPAKVPETLDYQLWQGPAPRRPYRSNVIHYNWHWFWHWGTGEIGNNGVHGLDLCRWGLGVDYPAQVASGGGLLFFDDDQQTPDSQVVTYQFDEQMIVWEGRNWHRRGFEGEMFGAAFYGEQGTLVLTGAGYKIYDRGDKLVEQQTGSGGDAAHLANFLAAIRSGTPLNAEIEEGYKSTLLCLLGSIAHRTGHCLHCDQRNGHIRGDPAAEALWSRQYEPGWEPKV